MLHEDSGKALVPVSNAKQQQQQQQQQTKKTAGYNIKGGTILIMLISKCYHSITLAQNVKVTCLLQLYITTTIVCNASKQ